MPRPSLKETRSEELLEAFARCVASYGLDGSTLDRISKEAGVGRPLLRHYLGNRDEMVAALLDHVMGKFAHMTEAMISFLPTKNRVGALLDILFSNHGHEPENAAIFQALIAASDRYPAIVPELTRFLDDFEKAIEAEITREHPSSNRQTCKLVASGISSIYFNHDATLPLNPKKVWRDRQRGAAELLIKAL